jgi:uncharacterized membrane protein
LQLAQLKRSHNSIQIRLKSDGSFRSFSSTGVLGMLNNKSPFLWTMPPGWLRFFIIILLFLGIFFRFVNLDQKVYWIDEAFTSLRVSGYTEAEVVQELSNTGIVGIDSLQKYQRPNSDKGILGTINSLAIEDPHHPPLYYLIARFWAQCFGNSVAVMRTLPALFSLLALPCIYWLCLELFESSLTGWVAVALLAISPFQVLYAQESREYSLWTVTILASSLALLRARRRQTKASWFIYAVTLTLSLYTFLFSALVALGHGIYIVAIERFRLTKVLISYLLALLAGMLLFSPWLIVFITNWGQFQHAQGWINIGESSIVYLFLVLAQRVGLIFIDTNSSPLDVLIYKDFFTISSLALLALVLYSLYFICKTTPLKIWLFVILLVSIPALFLIIPDLIKGGFRVGVGRYQIPIYLGVQIAVSYLLASKITAISTKVWQQKTWQLIMIALVSGGVLSCAINSQVEVPWSKSLGNGIPNVARILNKATAPLLIGSPTPADLLSLSYRVDPKLKLLVKPKCFGCHVDAKSGEKLDIPTIPDSFSDVFLSRAGSFEKWVNGIEKEASYKLNPVLSQAKEIIVWRLEK